MTRGASTAEDAVDYDGRKLDEAADLLFDLLERSGFPDREIRVVRSKAGCVTVSFGTGNGQIRASSPGLLGSLSQAIGQLVALVERQRVVREEMLARQVEDQRAGDAAQRGLEERARALIEGAKPEGAR